jgi:2-furoyl-CoA dehydrogenase FAD binding subunit
VKPAPFRYERPETVEEAVALLAEHGDEAKVLAGGQSLVPLLNMRMARPAVVVDINHVAGLDNMSHLDGAVRCGALVRQAAFSGASMLVNSCLPYVGHYVTRNRGTVCGSIAHADASAELPLALLVSDGSVVAASTRGRRTIAAEDFFITHFTTALEPDELVVETVWPKTGLNIDFQEVALRSGDYALCMAAAMVRDGEIRVGVGSVVDRPTLLEIDPERPGASAAAQVDPADTLHASAAYLRRLVTVLVDRVVNLAPTMGDLMRDAVPGLTEENL